MNISFDFFKRLEKKQKALVLTVLALLAVDIGAVIGSFFQTKYSSVFLRFENISNDVFPAKRMIALNAMAEKSKVSNGNDAFFYLTDEQKNALQKFYDENGNASISIVVSVPSVSEKKLQEIMKTQQPFYFGFLSESDFDKKNKLKVDTTKKTLSGTDLRNFIKSKNDAKETYFENSFAVSSGDRYANASSLPVGFFVQSSLPIRIIEAKIENALVGFNLTEAFPFFGVSANGGSFPQGKIVDFSGGTTVFSSQNSSSFVMPKIEVAFFDGADEKATINAGGEELNIYKTASMVTMQTENLTAPFSVFDISSCYENISRLLMVGNEKKLIPETPQKVLSPLRTDPGLLLKSKKSAWRVTDYELYAWDRFPKILFFDTKNYKVQSDFFRRLAFFTEKQGFKGRILTDEELGDMHGYNAHDYSAESLADFFSAVEMQNAKITEKEKILLEILLKNDIIKRSANGFEAVGGAVISISQESENWLRRSLSAHEIWHGLYFTDSDFQNITSAVYYTIDKLSLDFVLRYWQSQKSLGYDTNDEFLTKNEFMAYIMQQPLSAVAQYFVHLANRGSVMNAIPDLASYVRETGGRAYEDAARIFDSYAHDKWGLSCGRVWLVER